MSDITRAGGHLSVHADFNVHGDMKVERRLNLLVYLNEDWDPGYRGEFKLWDRQMKGCVRSIAPLLGKAVVFNTSLDSFHGQPDPLPARPTATAVRSPPIITPRSLKASRISRSDRRPSRPGREPPTEPTGARARAISSRTGCRRGCSATRTDSIRFDVRVAGRTNSPSFLERRGRNGQAAPAPPPNCPDPGRRRSEGNSCG